MGAKFMITCFLQLADIRTVQLLNWFQGVTILVKSLLRRKSTHFLNTFTKSIGWTPQYLQNLYPLYEKVIFTQNQCLAAVCIKLFMPSPQLLFFMFFKKYFLISK